MFFSYNGYFHIQSIDHLLKALRMRMHFKIRLDDMKKRCADIIDTSHDLD